jgi:hypothetical protein
LHDHVPNYVRRLINGKGNYVRENKVEINLEVEIEKYTFPISTSQTHGTEAEEPSNNDQHIYMRDVIIF